MSEFEEFEEEWEEGEDGEDEEEWEEGDGWEAGDMDLPVSEITFEKGEGKPWESKLGGCPYLSEQEEYPIGKNGKPMLFLAQINLKDIHNMPAELPDHGLLQFYVEQEEAFGLYSPAVVRWIEDVKESEEGLLKKHPFADEAYQKALPFETPGRMCFTETEMSEDVEESCRVGGYPYYPQDGELDPEEEFLLLQLADEGTCQIGFGDCGACHFIIDRAALAARDFSDVLYAWQTC